MGNFFSDTWKDLTSPGWRQQDEANDLNAQAMAQQAGSEAFKQQQARDLEKMAIDYILGNEGSGVKPDNPAYITGALPRAESWMKSYLSFLQGSPDTTFQQQKSVLERNTATARDNLNKMMARRGLNTSGLSVGKMTNLDLSLGRDLGNLVAQREQRRGQNLATGAQTTQTLLDRGLNMYTGAKSGMMGLNTQIPGMLQNQAAQALSTTQQPGVLQTMAGNWAKNTLNDYLDNTSGWTENASGGGSFFKKAIGLLLG